jgi:hypothetical protein
MTTKFIDKSKISNGLTKKKLVIDHNEPLSVDPKNMPASIPDSSPALPMEVKIGSKKEYSFISTSTQNPETQKRQALARVYALLIRLADDEKSVKVQTVDGETKDSKEVTHEMQSKDAKQASSPSPGAKD